MFCWLIFVHGFTFIVRCSSKNFFCWLIFVHVFTLTISLKGALFTCTYESNQSIEWTNRINEWKQWIEPMNRTNEMNQWIESLSRESRQWVKSTWLSKRLEKVTMNSTWHRHKYEQERRKPPSVRVLCWDNLVKNIGCWRPRRLWRSCTSWRSQSSWIREDPADHEDPGDPRGLSKDSKA